jgi:hypothetical protein
MLVHRVLNDVLNSRNVVQELLLRGQIGDHDESLKEVTDSVTGPFASTEGEIGRVDAAKTVTVTLPQYSLTIIRRAFKWTK